MEKRVRHHQMCLEIRIIWRTFPSLAQAAISPRQLWFGNSSLVPMSSWCSPNHRGLLLGQRVSLSHLWLHIPSLPARDGTVTPGQMQICSRCCCSWPGFQLDGFLGLTQRLTKTRRGIGGDGDGALRGRTGLLLLSAGHIQPPELAWCCPDASARPSDLIWLLSGQFGEGGENWLPVSSQLCRHNPSRVWWTESKRKLYVLQDETTADAFSFVTVLLHSVFEW